LRRRNACGGSSLRRISCSVAPRPARALPPLAAAVLLRANMNLKKLLAKSKARY
jgi:hypothetical protein